MKVVGIVAEYNPFHMGHLYHVEESRRMVGKGEPCAVVAVMSGNYVQRGDIAVFPKHVRAEAACMAPGGPDLVIELPTPFACSSAERFATSAVSLMKNSGIITHISFGSETGNVDILSRLADCIESPEFQELLKEELSDGTLYPLARQRAANRIVGSDADLMRTPNNILGIEYLRALRRLGSDIVPVTMKRLKTDHDSDYADEEVASASYIRNMFFGGRAYSAMRYIPEGAIEVYIREMAKGTGPSGLSMIDQAVLSQLRRLKPEDFEKISDVSDGLQYRTYNAVRKATSFAQAADLIKSKAYTHSRIRRILMHAYIGITSRWESVLPPYIKVLAFNETGRALLRQMKSVSKLPIITKPADAVKVLEQAECNQSNKMALELLDLESIATDLYMLACPAVRLRFAGQELITSPIYIE
ncbi:MAG: nucleotidyltransferase family protein [Eubacteriales bacterium]|jgi:predicted nucleotidyltransferase